jgi:hypothetical protein
MLFDVVHELASGFSQGYGYKHLEGLGKWSKVKKGNGENLRRKYR